MHSKHSRLAVRFGLLVHVMQHEVTTQSSLCRLSSVTNKHMYFMDAERLYYTPLSISDTRIWCSLHKHASVSYKSYH